MDKNITDNHKKAIEATRNFLSHDAPRIIKVEALNAIQDSFQHQGFTDRTLVKWEPRKIPKKNGKPITGKTLEKWKAKNEGRAILIGHQTDTKGGHLKDGFYGEDTPEKVTIFSDKVYGEVHNEGLRAGRPPGFDMPERRMIGPSETTEQRMIEKIQTAHQKRLNSI